jgi:hypothetical protein
MYENGPVLVRYRPALYLDRNAQLLERVAFARGW